MKENKSVKERIINSIGCYKNPNKCLVVKLGGALVFSIIVAYLIYFLINRTLSPLYTILPLFIIGLIFEYLRNSLEINSKIKKIEMVFPDFIQLIASNLRAGITIDKAFLLSARPEFGPLEIEIQKTGKEIATGKDILIAMKDMAKRINSEKITKTIQLIISGIRAGGNISKLLEQTSSNMREKEFLEKRASANVLMYVIFIFFAVGIGAPLLFGLSTILVEIIVNIVRTLPSATSTQISLPFTFRDIGLSVNFVVYFSIIFVIATDFISSLVIGLVNTGDSKSGIKYFIPLLIISLIIFFIIRGVLGATLVQNFSSLK